MPAQIAMPMIKPAADASLYAEAYRTTRVSITRPIRRNAGDTESSYDGLDIQLDNLAADSILRNVHAMTKGYLLFGYMNNAGSEDARCQSRAERLTGPTDDKRVRAILMLAPGVHGGHFRGGDIIRYQPTEESLIAVHQNFNSLNYIEYRNLDLLATKAIISRLIQAALDTLDASPQDENADWILSSPVIPPPRGRAGRGVNFKTWITQDDHTIEEYLNSILFEECRLRRIASGNASRQEGEVGFQVNVGDIFGRISHVDSEQPAQAGNCKLFLKFWDSAHQVINPCFFFNALAKHHPEAAFMGDADNKWGLPLLADSTSSVSIGGSPDPRIHPILWALASGEHGVYELLPDSSQFRPAPYPPLYVPSAAFAIHDGHINFDLIDRNERRLSNFHTHKRIVGERIIQGGRYQWKLDGYGYLVFRTNPEGNDDWYPFFDAAIYEKMKTFWEGHGPSAAILGEIFELPCEILGAICGKESGGVARAVGLEPWIPPPPDYINQPPFTNRTALETIPPDQLLNNYRDLPALKYLFMTHIWNPEEGKWLGPTSITRAKAIFDPRNANIIFRRQYNEARRRSSRRREPPVPPETFVSIKQGRIVGNTFIPVEDPPLSDVVRAYQEPYLWSELLADLDYYGNSPGSSASSQPPEIMRPPTRDTDIPSWSSRARYRNDKRFSATFDQRMSPGISQNLVSNVRFPPLIAPFRNNILAFDANFFLQQGLQDPAIIGDVWLPDTPPSFRFLWLLEPLHSLFNSHKLLLVAINSLNGSIRGKTIGERGSYHYRLDNDPWDPLLAVAVYGGTGDVEVFNPERPFGFGPDTHRWSTFPKHYNALVRVFEQYELFGDGGFANPTARFIRVSG